MRARRRKARRCRSEGCSPVASRQVEAGGKKQGASLHFGLWAFHLPLAALSFRTEVSRSSPHGRPSPSPVEAAGVSAGCSGRSLCRPGFRTHERSDFDGQIAKDRAAQRSVARLRHLFCTWLFLDLNIDASVIETFAIQTCDTLNMLFYTPICSRSSDGTRIEGARGIQ